jgi:hypothetical protein
MTEDLPDLEPLDVARWAPGWYADPWTAGQYRFWSGEAWTGDTHRSGPAAAYGERGGWSPSATIAGGSLPSTIAPSVPAPVPPYRSPRRGRITAIGAGLVVLVLVAGAIGYAIESHSRSKHATATTAPTPTTAPDSGPTAADARALSQLVIQQADAGPTRVVLLIPNGNRTSEPTLDLCNGTFATEKLRVARLQVAELDSAQRLLLSTEAVTYRNATATKSAFAELRKVAAACPHAPVKSPVKEGTAETRFNPPPDKAWPHTPSVERLAYSLVTTAAGTKNTSIAVYLRRGRVLLGLYFPQPDGPQPAVDGKTSVESIVGLFEARMAHLPKTVVNGSS